MTSTQILNTIVDEGESSLLRCTFETAAGDELDGDSILTLTLRLTAARPGTIINGRDDQNVRNNNGGELDPDGAYRFKFGPLDNTIQVPGTEKELRLATFTFTWVDDQGVTMTGKQTFGIYVQAKQKVSRIVAIGAGSAGGGGASPGA